ncbi:RING domain protein [Hokovirus HKV1]|uniref:RING domain protein n=1 Tax=Hokovirus HKV1 TaxID=1977638 RepID=A0A1V0SFC7_9VIRU|nr:RING domain protein [Hokovirus HKV1]
MDQETQEKYNYVVDMFNSIQNLDITKIYQLASNRYQDNYIDIIIPKSIIQMHILHNIMQKYDLSDIINIDYLIYKIIKKKPIIIKDSFNMDKIKSKNILKELKEKIYALSKNNYYYQINDKKIYKNLLSSLIKNVSKFKIKKIRRSTFFSNSNRNDTHCYIERHDITQHYLKAINIYDVKLYNHCLENNFTIREIGKIYFNNDSHYNYFYICDFLNNNKIKNKKIKNTQILENKLSTEFLTKCKNDLTKYKNDLTKHKNDFDNYKNNLIKYKNDFDNYKNDFNNYKNDFDNYKNNVNNFLKKKIMDIQNLDKQLSSRIDILDQETKPNECVICMLELKNVAFVDCGHYVCCNNCANQVNKCPICRKTINQKIIIY